jgi:hypothetical protein
VNKGIREKKLLETLKRVADKLKLVKKIKTDEAEVDHIETIRSK